MSAILNAREPPKFRGAGLFLNHALWLRLLKESKEMGIVNEKYAEKTVELGLVDINDKLIFNENRTGFRFKHSHSNDIVFQNKQHAIDHFKGLSESQRNYKGIKDQPGAAQIQKVGK